MVSYVNDGLVLLKGWFEKATRWQKDLFVQIWNGSMMEEEICNRAIKLIEQEHMISSY